MIQTLPFISCICPTYKRPQLLRNAIACFEAQNYPKDRCELIILDDANQFSSGSYGNWRLSSTDIRFPNLPEKYNHLVAECRGELIAVWEDDDIFLPWNLMDTAEAYNRIKSEFLVPEFVWSTEGQPLGCARIRKSRGMFHSSWRFTRRLFDEVGGYSVTNELAFDIEFRDKLLATTDHAFYGRAAAPSYVYRWGNGYWHGSGHGVEGFTSLWQHVGSLPAPPQGEAYACLDHETKMIIDLTSDYKTNF